MRFEVTPEQQEKIDKWLKEVVYPERVAKQRGTEFEGQIFTGEDGTEYPYEGAIGGGLTYCFTGTSLGDVVVVKYTGGYELNVTEYDSW